MFVSLKPLALFAAAASVCICGFAAEITPQTQAEVEQLLSRLASSGCQFQRNGSWHDGAEARSHIERKYRYGLKKHMVGTTEDFIAMAATESSMSGKPYAVKCPNQEQVSSAQWMNAQLKQLRGGGKSAAARQP